MKHTLSLYHQPITRIIVPGKNCCKKLSLQATINYSTKDPFNTTLSTIYFVLSECIYIICPYCRRMMYLDIGSFLNNVQKKIMMNIFIVFHSSILPREYKEVGRKYFLVLKFISN